MSSFGILMLILNLLMGSSLGTATYEDLGYYTYTAYCDCEVCCGVWASQPIQRTASGSVPHASRTVASSWSTFDVGQKIYSEELGRKYIEDKPADFILRKYNHKIIDVYFNSHQEALNFGKQQLRTYKIHNERIDNMISIIKGDSTFTAVEHNISSQEGKHQLWITRPTGKSFKIVESGDLASITELKQAIDYAIEKGEKAFRLD